MTHRLLNKDFRVLSRYQGMLIDLEGKPHELLHTCNVLQWNVRCPPVDCHAVELFLKLTDRSVAMHDQLISVRVADVFEQKPCIQRCLCHFIFLKLLSAVLI